MNCWIPVLPSPWRLYRNSLSVIASEPQGAWQSLEYQSLVRLLRSLHSLAMGIMFKKCCSKDSEVAFIIELLDTNVKTFQRSSDIYEKNIVQVAVLPE